MDTINSVNSGLTTIKKGIEIADSGIVSKLIDKAYLPANKADEFLSEQALKNGVITEEDLDRAATIYSSFKMKKAYKSIYKTRKKADTLISGKIIEDVDDLDEDWFSAFEEHVSKISDESILDLWAAILAGKVMRIGTFRKIMLNRIALLDASSVKAFTELCYRTYTFSLSDGQTHKIPFYICDTEFGEMNKFDSSKLTQKEKSDYCKELPSEQELQILEEIGLITLGEDFETTDFCNDKDLSFKITINDENIVPFSIVQKGSEYYKTVWNGSVIYTAIGTELYNILSSFYQPKSYLMPVVKKYNLFMKSASELQRKNERNPLYRLKHNKNEFSYL